MLSKSRQKWYDRIMKTLITISIFSVLIFVVGMVFIFPESFSLCDSGPGYRECKDQYDRYETQGALLALFAPIFFLVSVIVYSYIKIPEAFRSWSRFAKCYLPIAAVLILLSPTTSASLMGFDKELVTWWLAGIFFVVSLGIIFSNRRALGRPVSK